MTNRKQVSCSHLYFWGSLHSWGSIHYCSCVYFCGCLLKLSIFFVKRATLPIHWIKYHQKSIAAVRCILALPRNLLQTHRKDIRTKFPQGVHWTKSVNTEQYFAMLDNIRKFLTKLENILTFLRLLLQLRKRELK